MLLIRIVQVEMQARRSTLILERGVSEQPVFYLVWEDEMEYSRRYGQPWIDMVINQSNRYQPWIERREYV